MKKKIILFLITIVSLSLFVFVSCSNSETPEENNIEDEEVVEEEQMLFEDNENVNEFFFNYQKLSNTEFKDYSSSRKYTCSAENSGYWFSVSDFSTNGTLEVRIEETNDTAEAGVPAMREVYYYTVKTLDNTLSDEDIYKIFDGRMNDEDEYKGEQTLSSLTILITPDMELSGGHNRGHIDITKNIEE